MRAEGALGTARSTPVLAALVAAGLAVSFSPRLPADSWSFESEERVVELPGSGRMVLSVDASRSAQQPDFIVVVDSGSSTPVSHPGIWFRDIAVSPDGAFIVGLSNRGIPDSAAAVFGRDGKLLVYAAHDPRDLDYCLESVTLVREWYDAENPDVRFGASGDLTQITLRDCRGQRVPLLEAMGATTSAPGQ